jgi:hypothetical protein
VNSNDPRLNAEYESVRRAMENDKEEYRTNFEKLKNLKTQIEHAQYLIEKSQVKLQKDFENWWEEQCELVEEQKRKQKNSNSNNEDYSIGLSLAAAAGRQRNDSIQTVSTVNSTSASSLASSRNNSSLNTTLLNKSYQVSCDIFSCILFFEQI